MEFIETNWLLILLVAVAAIVIAWYIFHAARRTRVTGETRDVLDEGATPAARNQALIDALPATAASPMIAPVAPPGLAGAGLAVEAAVAENVASDPASGTPAGADDLARLKGVGPKLVAQLNALGINRFAQIAGWTESDIDRIDAELGRFSGRIRRDSWVEQARLLSVGDESAFAARFGNVS